MEVSEWEWTVRYLLRTWEDIWDFILCFVIERKDMLFFPVDLFRQIANVFFWTSAQYIRHCFYAYIGTRYARINISLKSLPHSYLKDRNWHGLIPHVQQKGQKVAELKKKMVSQTKTLQLHSTRSIALYAIARVTSIWTAATVSGPCCSHTSGPAQNQHATEPMSPGDGVAQSYIPRGYSDCQAGGCLLLALWK